MKKNELTLLMAVLIFAAFGLTSCGGSGTKSDDSGVGSTPSDQIFGELPSMVAKYESKLAENEQDQKKNTDLNKAFKLSQEENQLKEEANKEVESYFNGLKEPLTAPVTQEGDTAYYKISELVLTKANFKNFMVKANIEVLDSIYMAQAGWLSIHIQIYKNNEPTKDWIVLGYNKGEKNGNIWEVKGGTYCSFLVGVSKLVVKSKDAYLESIKSK